LAANVSASQRTELEHRAHLANAHAAQAVTQVDSLFDGLAEDEAGEHTTRESVTSAVSVDNLVCGHLRGRVHKGLLLTLHGADGRLGTVRNEHRAQLAQLRGRVSHLLCNLLQVRGV